MRWTETRGCGSKCGAFANQWTGIPLLRANQTLLCPRTPSSGQRITIRAATEAVPQNERIRNMLEWQQEEHLFFERRPSKDGSIAEPIEIVYAYPNEYAVGICSLGYQIVWATLCGVGGTNVTRLFTDAMEPLPYRADLLGFSMSWELDYVGIFAQLEFVGVPRRALERSEGDPIVFGGGPVLTANPEPFADFFDVILLGDGEDSIPALVEKYRSCEGQSRQTILSGLAQVPGIYVPSLYMIQYESKTGPIASITPLECINPEGTEVPETVQKATFRGNTLATSTVVTPRCAWENIFMIEAVRSCPEMCTFCLASYVTLPFRAAPVHDRMLPSIDRALGATNRIGILGASVTQHPQFNELLEALRHDKYSGMRLSLSSVRTSTVTEDLAKTLVMRGSKSITVAVESGSERLRQIVNKKLNNEDIAKAAIRAQAGGLSSMKLYGMAGIPGEIQEDHMETVQMFKDLKKAAPGLKLTFGCSTFVPKAHTPFQWFGCTKKADKAMKGLKKELGRLGVDFRPESHKWSIVQAVISRGDRRVSRILELVSGYGDTLGSFRRAFKEMKGEIPPLEHYAYDDWPIDAVLPWNHLRTAINPDRILNARRTAESHFRPESEEFSRATLL